MSTTRFPFVTKYKGKEDICYFCSLKNQKVEPAFELHLRPITYAICRDHAVLLKTDLEKEIDT